MRPTSTTRNYKDENGERRQSKVNPDDKVEVPELYPANERGLTKNIAPTSLEIELVEDLEWFRSRARELSRQSLHPRRAAPSS